MSLKMNQFVRLRPMTLDDLAQVQSIDKTIFNDPWPKDAFKYELTQNQRSICWVAEVEIDPKKIIGFVVIWLILDEAHIGTFAIIPEYRGMGIGRRLLATALLDSTKRGASKALLEVRVSNLQAQQLYYGLGFETVGLRAGYYPDNHEDAFLMNLEFLDSEKLHALAGQ